MRIKGKLESFHATTRRDRRFVFSAAVALMDSTGNTTIRGAEDQPRAEVPPLRIGYSERVSTHPTQRII